jgi:hypothetical protein
VGSAQQLSQLGIILIEESCLRAFAVRLDVRDTV